MPRHLLIMNHRRPQKYAQPDVLFESASSVVVSKPAGMPVIPGRSPDDAFSLRQWAEQRYGGARIYVVHRIDKPVSGVVLLARTPQAHRSYCMAFERGTIDKRYLGVVEGSDIESEGEIAIPLEESPGAHRVIVTSETGRRKLHRTRYRVLERFLRFALVEIATLSGFRHQIRAHFNAIGHPLAVDPLYGRRHRITLSDIKGKHRYRATHVSPPSIMDRVSLHAHSIRFEEYPSAELRTMEAPLPNDFTYLIKALRKYDT